MLVLILEGTGMASPYKSLNFVKTFLRTSRIRNIALTWILARVFPYLPPFVCQINNNNNNNNNSGLYLLNCFDFYFDLFWIAWHWKPAIKGIRLENFEFFFTRKLVDWAEIYEKPEMIITRPKKFSPICLIDAAFFKKMFDIFNLNCNLKTKVHLLFRNKDH